MSEQTTAVKSKESLWSRFMSLNGSAVFLAMIVVGGAGDMSAVWQMADIFNGLMALPNLTAILLLSPEALSLWRTWAGKQALSCNTGGKSLY